jgi:acyl CoA:acetate/3-ketoacid CoA transferase alpha subunit
MLISEGKGELVGWHDPDDNRKWIAENKPRDLFDKRMDVSEAVKKYVTDGCFIASGGFGHVRVSMTSIYEIIRQKKRNLTMAGKTAVHDLDLLVGSGCVNRVEVAYAFGHELRGLSPGSKRAVETGKCKVVAEISNAGYQWRFLAGMMGIPFMPARNLLGSDTLGKSSAKVIKDPFSGKPVCLLPACYPDVAIIHVPRCDKYGNAQIDGIIVEDFELARAARRLIISTEEIIDEEEIRKTPWRTAIPFYHVDAVVEQKFGSHPCQMPLQYFFDEEHIGEWLSVSKTDEGIEKYLDKYVGGVDDFSEYIKLIGGENRMKHLADVEMLRAPMTAPWLKEG